MPEKNPSVGNRLRALAEQAGLKKQRDLAKALGVSDNAITNYLSKGRVPEWDVLLKISSVFGVTVDYLLKGEKKSGEPPALGIRRAHRPLDLTPPSQDVAELVSMAWSVLESEVTAAEALRLSIVEFYDNTYGEYVGGRKADEGGSPGPAPKKRTAGGGA